MENEFHLSIKNTQRKIRDVRDLFCNLTYNEKLCLEKEKVFVEQQLNIIQQEYNNNNNNNYKNNNINNINNNNNNNYPYRTSFNNNNNNNSRFYNNRNRSMANKKENVNYSDHDGDDEETMDHHDIDEHDDIENRNVVPKSSRKKKSDSEYDGSNGKITDDGFHDDNNNNSHLNNNFTFKDSNTQEGHNDDEVMRSDETNETTYEKKVKSVYERFNREAVEDFSKYLSDDEDIVATLNRHKDPNYQASSSESPEITDEQKNSTNSTMANNGNEKKERKKLKSNSLFKKSSKKKSKKVAEEAAAKEPNTTDMCGLFPLEPSPKDKERMEKQHTKGGLSGIKNKIKQFFTADGTIRDSNGNQVSVPPPGFLPERSIQNVDYSSSKIGYSGATYDDYYNQVNDLRNFDMEARMKNYKYNPNNKIAIMDESFNLHYSKMNTDSGKAQQTSNNNNNNNNNESPPPPPPPSSSSSSATKSKLFNNKLTSIFTKAKVFNKT